MKILIINPPSFDHFQYIKEGRCESRKGGQLTPPITLGIIAKLLSDNGYPNRLYDFMADPVSQETLENILSRQFDIVFISVSAQTFKFDKKTAAIIRKNNKDCLICALGVLPSALPEKVLSEVFDVCIIGEPEYAALDIVKKLELKNKDFLNKIKGIAFLHHRKIIKTENRPVIENLDDFPFPDRDKMPLSRYVNPATGKPFTAIKIGRGCPYGCSFCTASFYYGRRARYRSPENIIDEIETCISKYNIHDFMFLADTFTADQDFVRDLCSKIIMKKLKVTWSCNSRIDTFNDELAKHMAHAGCRMISFGVESASEKIIKENFKKIDPDKAIYCSRLCRKYGIKSMMYYILGFPNETKDEIKMTIALSLKVNSDIARFFIATPLPGSALYGKIKEKPNLNTLNLSNVNANISGMTNKELRKMINYAYFRYYARPGQLLRTMSVFSKNFPMFFKSGKEYFNSYLHRFF